MINLDYRRWQILLTFFSVLILGSSLYFQYIKKLEPCPLCLMQRLSVFLLFVVCVVGIAVRRHKGAKRVACFQFFFAACGLFFALRQLWLQSLPAHSVPACMPGLDTLIRYFPWQDVMRSLFWGTGECAKDSWRWLGLSMPAWSALIFLFYLVTAILPFFIFWKQLVIHRK